MFVLVCNVRGVGRTKADFVLQILLVFTCRTVCANEEARRQWSLGLRKIKNGYIVFSVLVISVRDAGGLS